MTVDTNDPTSNSTPISSLIGSLLDPRPEEDGNAGAPSQDRVREEEGKGERPPENRPPLKRRRKDDPFLYFSNDKLRLEHLLGKEIPHLPFPEKPVKRKTRISFEVDPFLAMVSTYPELLDESQ